MALETGTYVADLAPSNPPSSDPVGQGDDHLRLIKSVLQATFPNMGSTLGQVRSLDVATSISSTWNTNLIVTTASATATAVLTLPPSASITSGFNLSFFTTGGANISLLPSGANTINGAGSLAIGESSWGLAVYQGGGLWRAGSWPNGATGSIINNNLTVKGTTTLSGATRLSTTLTVDGATTLSGSVQLNTTLSVNGRSSFSGSVDMLTSLRVLGSATIAAMSVAGQTTLSGSVRMNSLLTVDGAATISGSVRLNSTLTVDGAATISGAVRLNSTLTVDGASTFAGAVSISGAVRLTTTLTVDGATTLSGSVQVNGNLAVNGRASFSSSVEMAGNLRVLGASSVVQGLTVQGAATISATLDLTGGQIRFPSTQNLSADPNVLDDYEEGTFTLTVTFATPGTLSVTYTARSGTYCKVGAVVVISIYLVCATFVPGTASGNFLIGTLPYATEAGPGIHAAHLTGQGYTLDANYTQVALASAVAGSASLLTYESGSNLALPGALTVTHWNGARAPVIYANFSYMLR